jgi:ABC-type transport system involved in cytochrome c biogenesis permease subunit
VRGWRGERAAWLLIIGFAVVMFTYLGMHLLPTAEESAHVYTQ